MLSLALFTRSGTHLKRNNGANVSCGNRHPFALGALGTLKGRVCINYEGLRFKGNCGCTGGLNHWLDTEVCAMPISALELHDHTRTADMKGYINLRSAPMLRVLLLCYLRNALVFTMIDEVLHAVFSRSQLFIGSENDIAD